MVTSVAMATTKVAVLDTGYNGTNPKLCATGHYDFVNDVVGIGEDKHKDFHGTHVVNAIINNAGQNDYCVLVYKVFGGKKYTIPRAIERAIKDKVTVLNLSFTGEEYDNQEIQAIFKARKAGIKIFVASGNEGKDLDKECTTFPACYNITVVGSTNPKANHGMLVNQYEEWCFEGLCGTSLSTGIATGKYIGGIK